MNTSLKTRAAALIASMLLTFVTVQQVADYARPAPADTVLAAATVAAPSDR